jgi:large subunit ribosomal protein L29e
MAKSKNHTNHNQSRKNHRNGIKKPSKFQKGTEKGTYTPFRKNQRFAKLVITFF